MILIDSLYINNSGGLRLLQYLVDILLKKNIEFFILADSRCYGLFDRCKHVRYMNASLWERKKFYQAKKNRFSSVLCFGNIPAPIRLEVPVYTYFHNINLLTLAEARSLSVKVKSRLKREVFKHYKKNTDYWLVQTSNTANELINHLGEKPERVKLMPFYELPKSLRSLNELKHGDDYVYISNYTGAKGHEELLMAWRILHERGVEKTLHLTIPESARSFVGEIEKAQQDGVKVVNHGFVPFAEVLELYKKSKVIIYPSHNESLGLGIIEAINTGCDVIGADLPYTYAICKPSAIFNPHNAVSIADAVIEYEKDNTTKSELLISNHIDELIDLLVKDN